MIVISNSLLLVINLFFIILKILGNMLTIVEGLSKLSALTELNLRRNSIKTVSELDTLPGLLYYNQ
jgi:hypothetical protein